MPDVPDLLAGSYPGADWFRAVKQSLTYLDGVAAGLGRRNVLINSHFDVWQRGTSITIPTGGSGGYTADRWLAYRNASGSTVSRQAGVLAGSRYLLRMQRTLSNTDEDDITVEQPLETATAVTLAGKTCELKITLEAGANFSAADGEAFVMVVSGTGTDETPIGGFTGETALLNENVALSGDPEEFTFTVEVPSSATQLSVRVGWSPVGTAGAADLIDVHAVQLVAGVASAYERLPYQVTFAECQRFYQVLSPSGAGICNATTTALRWTRALPTVMRAVPTLTITNAKFYDGSVSRPYSSTTTSYHTTTTLQADLAVSGGNFTALGRPAVMYDAGSGALRVSAEIGG